MIAMAGRTAVADADPIGWRDRPRSCDSACAPVLDDLITN